MLALLARTAAPTIRTSAPIGSPPSAHVDAADLGCKNMRNMKPVLIEHLLGEEDFVLSPDALGIYIPADELPQRYLPADE